MKITLTLEEVLDKCSDWEKFCEDKGYSVYCVNEGGGDIEITLTEEEANKYNLLMGKNFDTLT